MKKHSLILIFGIAVVVLVALLSGYFYWQRSVQISELAKVEKNLTDLENQILQFEHQQVTQAISAKKTVNALKDELVEWSKVIKKVRSTVPKKKGLPLVDILSYSASSGRTINMSAKTFPGSSEPYVDVADLIKGFDDEANFREVFVPSISSGLSDEGEEILSFMFSAEYVDENVEAILEKSDTEIETEVELPTVLR